MCMCDVYKCIVFVKMEVCECMNVYVYNVLVCVCCV